VLSYTIVMTSYRIIVAQVLIKYGMSEMNRFNFRAWHVDHQEMVVFDNANIACDQYQCAAIFALMTGQTPGVLMQSTGLFDQHGIEIYEGDVVTDHVGKGVVEFSEGNAGFRVNYKDGICKWFYDYSLRGERESIEVIGNVYDTPGLSSCMGCYEI